MVNITQDRSDLVKLENKPSDENSAWMLVTRN